MTVTFKSASVALFVVLPAFLLPQTVSHPLTLQLDPAQTVAEITLPATLHTVHGSFSLKHGAIQYDPASGKASGEIVFDATTGKTGNSSRDHTMHKDVIESPRFPEIAFRADRAEGALAASGTSTMKVHGLFGVHGAEHEITIPVQVNLAGNRWTATASFSVPYVQWGMKNPSNFFLHVPDAVDVTLRAGGNVSP